MEETKDRNQGTNKARTYLPSLAALSTVLFCQRLKAGGAKTAPKDPAKPRVMFLRHSRRSLIGLGTTLAIVGSPSPYSRVQALAEQGNAAAFVSCGAFLGRKRAMGSKRVVLGLDVLIAPRRMTMNGRKISVLSCKHRQRCFRAVEGTFSTVPTCTRRATTAGAGALSAVSLLLHDQPVGYPTDKPNSRSLTATLEGIVHQICALHHVAAFGSKVQ